MMVLLILILIPLFCITVSLFIMSLFNYITLNELDIFMISITMFIILVLGFVIMRLLINNSKETSVYLLNIDNNFLSIFGFYSFNIVALLGICLIINSIIYKMNIFNLTIGLVIMGVYIWIFVFYILTYKNKVFTITMIDKVNDFIDLIYLSDEEHEYELYIKHDQKYAEEQRYLCKYNPMSKEIRKIIERVVEEGINDEQ